MGCAGSAEGEGYGDEVKVDSQGPALPAPTGEQFFVVFGDKINLSTYLASADTKVENVISFANWQLSVHKDKLPEGYSLDDAINCLTSPHVLTDGLVFCPADKIDELDGWEEKERFLIACSTAWKNSKYLEDEEMCEKLKQPDYWAAHHSAGTGLVVVHNTDLRVEDIPEEFLPKPADA